MLISEIMTKGTSTCTEDTPLADVYALIQGGVDRCVVVVDSIQHHVPIGIVNERTICESIIQRQQPARTLDAGGTMSTNIQRVSSNSLVADCKDVLDRRPDAILVVDERRRFLGTIDPVSLARSTKDSWRRIHTAEINSGTPGQHMPAPVEIPAFGWLK